MKYFNLEIKREGSTSFMLLIWGVVTFLIIMPLNGQAQQTDGVLTKEIDFSHEVTRVTQKYDYWCVYACLESLDTGFPQCTHCCDFLRRFYMNGERNPYQFVDDEAFDNAMKVLKADTNKTCTSSENYADFGVVGEKFAEYLKFEDFSESSMRDFSKKITEEDSDDPSVSLFVNTDGNTAHCVVFLGSKLYNNNWSDPNSVIYLMNPEFESIRETTYHDLLGTYDDIYSK